MLLTESEAKTKWCPHVRVVFPAANVANKVSSVLKKIIALDGNEAEKVYIQKQEAECFCINSACSQWRWHDPAPVPGLEYQTAMRRGYCGLAGKPES